MNYLSIIVALALLALPAGGTAAPVILSDGSDIDLSSEASFDISADPTLSRIGVALGAGSSVANAAVLPVSWGLPPGDPDAGGVWAYRADLPRAPRDGGRGIGLSATPGEGNDASVPEPSTLLLLGSGLIGTGYLGKRKFRRR